MISKIILIDQENGISLLEITFKKFHKEKESTILSSFFSQIDLLINNIKKIIINGEKLKDSIKIIDTEYSKTVTYYHSLSKILFCSISESDDDVDKIKETLLKISNQFWKKHKSDLELYRTTTEKIRFQTFIIDIENFSFGGRIAEIFPKTIIVRSILDKILSMGMINELELKIALNCDGQHSPIKISKVYNKNLNEIKEILKKLEQLEIIKM